MALTPKRLFLSFCISISLLRSYTFFSRSPLVFKTLFETVHQVDLKKSPVRRAGEINGNHSVRSSKLPATTGNFVQNSNHTYTAVKHVWRETRNVLLKRAKSSKKKKKKKKERNRNFRPFPRYSWQKHLQQNRLGSKNPILFFRGLILLTCTQHILNQCSVW